MKQFILTICFALLCSISYSQLRVENSGKVIVGDVDGGAEEANFKTRGENELELAMDAKSGNADLTLQLNGKTKAQVKYLSSGGISFRAQHGNTGNFGLSGTDKFYVSGTLDRIGINTNSPSSALHVQGNVFCSGSYNSSDRKLKKDINEYSRGLNDILKLKTYSYYFNGKGNIKEDGLQIGVMAQDLQKVAPELVGTYEHETWKDTGNGESQELVKTEDFLYINASAIQWMLVNGMQEQQELINEKEQRISELENQISELANIVNELKNGLGSYESEVELNYVEFASLDQNRPNPFNGVTIVDYTIPSKSKKAEMMFFDPSGKVIKQYALAHIGKGELKITANDLPSGVYSYSLVIDGEVIDTKQMIFQH